MPSAVCSTWRALATARCTEAALLSCCSQATTPRRTASSSAQAATYTRCSRSKEASSSRPTLATTSWVRMRPTAIWEKAATSSAVTTA
ncbi:hypothetical protein D7X99_02175 [Corallococcus sp. AB032C]|nr:hypothetical protein D7X99_02175 [Corallococcus sp. AB032C]